MTDREVFLVEMYKKMWDNIDRHILVVWQSVGVLVGALATFALLDKQIVTSDYGSALDYATAFVVLTATWQLSHVYDANFWYNRNLLIIANIERQFLRPEDAHELHFYFLGHRKSRDMVGHLKVQRFFGLCVVIIVLLRHFALRVFPGFGSPISNFDPKRALPYAAIFVCSIFFYKLRAQQRQSYETLARKSPGKVVVAGETKIQEGGYS